jgi:hypothetical protein
MNQRLLASVCAVFFVAVGSVFAAADGVPQLDPTLGGSGTDYTVSMNGASHSMDPVLTGGAFAWKGTMNLTQDAGVPDVRADLLLDLNGDGTMDRQLSCSGMVGNNQFGMRCSDNDDLGEFRLSVTGKAVILDSGKLSLRKAAVRGYTDTYNFLSSFVAIQQ